MNIQSQRNKGRDGLTSSNRSVQSGNHQSFRWYAHSISNPKTSRDCLQMWMADKKKTSCPSCCSCSGFATSVRLINHRYRLVRLVQRQLWKPPAIIQVARKKRHGIVSHWCQEHGYQLGIFSFAWVFLHEGQPPKCSKCFLIWALVVSLSIHSSSIKGLVHTLFCLKHL